MAELFKTNNGQIVDKPSPSGRIFGAIYPRGERTHDRNTG